VKKIIDTFGRLLALAATALRGIIIKGTPGEVSDGAERVDTPDGIA
jgi:hypothetical protein